MILTAIRRWYWNRHREIFRYHDGTRYCRIDPVAAMISLDQDPNYLPDRHLPGAMEGDPESLLFVCRAAERTFGVQRFDGKKGLTIAETIGLLQGFDAYMLALKKNASPLPTPPPSTDAISPGSSGETTSDSLGFGSIGTDNSPAEPAKSEPESRPVSAECSPLSGSLT